MAKLFIDTQSSSPYSIYVIKFVMLRSSGKFLSIKTTFLLESNSTLASTKFPSVNRRQCLQIQCGKRFVLCRCQIFF